MKFREYIRDIIIESMTKEDNYRTFGGAIVKFGSESCIEDLKRRIEDAIERRNCCMNGSAIRSDINGQLKYLRKQLRYATKEYEKRSLMLNNNV